jgi:hypothetical protein
MNATTNTAFKSERTTRSHSFKLPLAAAKAFEFFTPEGERAWAEGWDPQYLHPSNGRTEAGMVFLTRHGGEETIWTMTRHEPANGVVEYVRTTPGSRTATVLVQCASLSNMETRVTVIYAFTPLSADGAEQIKKMDEAHYREFIDSWQSAILKSLKRPI